MWSDEEEATTFSGADLSCDSDNDASSPSQHVAGIIEDPEVWMDYYSEDLLDLWHALKDQCVSRGFAVLDNCTFPDFAQFCFRFSSGYPPPI